jgi:hypothetical protein
MSINTNVTDVMIGSGAAINTAGEYMNAAAAAQLGIIGPDMKEIHATASTIALAPYIFIANKLADGTFKKSSMIKGTSVTGWKGKHYTPSRRCVWGIGHQRGSVVDGTTVAASGTIEVANSTEYSFSIKFKNDKSFFSERPEVLRVTFTSAAAATQLTIATQIAAAINSSGYGSSVSGVKVVVAKVIGDGTGIDGLTAATDYGVEITGLTINQFQTTQYQEEIVNFDVFVDDSTGFGSTTTCTKIQGPKLGSGTYNQVYNMENKYSGLLNRRLWPAQTHTFLASSTGNLSGNTSGAATSDTGNVSVTISEDVATVATSTAGLRPGELITINAVAYEIKYIVSTTKFVVTAAFSATYSGAALKVKYFYNTFNITVNDMTMQNGSGVSQLSEKNIVIFSPAIDDAAADPFDDAIDSADTSAESIIIIGALNAWMTSTPLAPAALTAANML